MLRIEERAGLITITAGGTLESADYDRFVSIFERIAAQKAGTVPMLIVLMSDFSGWDLGGLWRDLKFDVKHKDSFGRIAIVGDRKWEEGGTKLFDPLFRAKMKFFTTAERGAAESWVREDGDVS